MWSEFWQLHWQHRPLRRRQDRLFHSDDGSKERRYVLDMFPYPSGDLHMGHAEAFVMGDIVSRFWKLRGFDVMHPIGWDSFGLPAENAAIARNAHPSEWTYANIGTQANSFKRYGLSFDWSRRLHTSDPEYYRWTQWLFLRFYERGLAYRKDSYVNWCPNDQHLRRTHIPVVIFHGTRDRVVPFSSALRLKACLKPGDHFVTIEGGAHNNLRDFELYHRFLGKILLPEKD